MDSMSDSLFDGRAFVASPKSWTESSEKTRMEWLEMRRDFFDEEVEVSVFHLAQLSEIREPALTSQQLMLSP